jgi:hypothetical protein
MKTTGSALMSNFDFNRLREQVKQTGETLRKQFKGTDANLQVSQNRSSDWYELNNARNKDPAYRKRLSEAIKNSPAVKQANIKKGQDPKFRSAVQKGMTEYINSPEYVNPRGMLGKKRSQESLEKQSQALKGKVKPLAGNKKISEYRLGKKPKAESIEKMRAKLLGKETGRSRKVKTPAGVFNKLKEAAEHYQVSTGTIKNFIAGKTVKEWFKPQLVQQGIKFKGLKPLGFSWVGDVKSELGPKKVHTPDGTFNNVTSAAEFYKISGTAVRYRIKTQPDKYYYI